MYCLSWKHKVSERAEKSIVVTGMLSLILPIFLHGIVFFYKLLYLFDCWLLFPTYPCHIFWYFAAPYFTSKPFNFGLVCFKYLWVSFAIYFSVFLTEHLLGTLFTNWLGPWRAHWIYWRWLLKSLFSLEKSQSLLLTCNWVLYLLPKVQMQWHHLFIAWSWWCEIWIIFISWASCHWG